MGSKKRKPLTKFTLFTELPYDLRYRIWMELLPPPRIVYLHWDQVGQWNWCYRVWSDRANDDAGNKSFFCKDTLHDELEEQAFVAQLDPNLRTNERRQQERAWRNRRRGMPNIDRCIGLRSAQPAIHVLAACRESYYIFARFYTKAFGTQFAFPETWFDYERDTLYLEGHEERGGWRSALGGNDTPDNLSAVDMRRVKNLAIDTLWNSEYDFGYWQSRLLQSFNNLETLSFTRSEIATCPSTDLEIVFEDSEACRIRRLCWDTYGESFHPITHQAFVRQYEGLVADIEAEKEQLQNNPTGSDLVMKQWSERKESPAIDFVGQTWESSLAKFQVFKEKYMRVKDEWKMSITLRSRGKKDFHLSLTDISLTVKDLVAMARVEWHISKARAFVDIFDDGYEEISKTAVVYDLVTRPHHIWEIQWQQRQRRRYGTCCNY